MSTAALRMQSFLLRVHVLTSRELTTQARSLHESSLLLTLSVVDGQACFASEMLSDTHEWLIGLACCATDSLDCFHKAARSVACAHFGVAMGFLPLDTRSWFTSWQSRSQSSSRSSSSYSAAAPTDDTVDTLRWCCAAAARGGGLPAAVACFGGGAAVVVISPLCEPSAAPATGAVWNVWLLPVVGRLLSCTVGRLAG